MSDARLPAGYYAYAPWNGPIDDDEYLTYSVCVSRHLGSRTILHDGFDNADDAHAKAKAHVAATKEEAMVYVTDISTDDPAVCIEHYTWNDETNQVEAA